MSARRRSSSRGGTKISTPVIEVEDLSTLSNQESVQSDRESLPPHPNNNPNPSSKFTRATTSPEVNSNTRSKTFSLGRKPRKNVAWKKKWSHRENPFQNGRVLIVDCFSRTHSTDGRRKTQTQEFTTPEELEKFYEQNLANKTRTPCLRIINVQNAVWARDILFRRYDIRRTEARDSHRNPFVRWAQYDKPQRRAGKPILNAKSFAMDKNIYRKVWRCGFGTDYLRYFPADHIDDCDDPRIAEFKLTSLNQWNEDEDGQAYWDQGPDVYVQRLSLYVQRNMQDAGLEEDEWDDSSSNLSDMDRYDDPAPTEAASKSFDNTTSIIVFESSLSRLVRDTLIEARSEVESKWRRIFTDLPRHDISTDSELALQCIDLAVGYIFTSLKRSWERFISKCDEHMSILEEKVYDEPANESRAPELSMNAAHWLKLEKLLSLQSGATGAFRSSLQELAMEPDREFLRDVAPEQTRIQTLIEEELTKPTVSLTDLVYKSVDIRDSRHSIELNSSMWRLSWITFIFLPLTFLSGFFGMNVDIFQPSGGFPHVWWYFAIGVPLILLVLLAVNMLRTVFDPRARDPIRRATYEKIFQKFSDKRDDLWTRSGPRQDVGFHGSFFNRLEWALIQWWFNPEYTIGLSAKPETWSSSTSALGIAGKLKTLVASYWLTRLPAPDPLSEAEKGSAARPRRRGRTDTDEADPDSQGVTATTTATAYENNLASTTWSTARPALNSRVQSSPLAVAGASSQPSAIGATVFVPQTHLDEYLLSSIVPSHIRSASGGSHGSSGSAGGVTGFHGAQRLGSLGSGAMMEEAEEVEEIDEAYKSDDDAAEILQEPGLVEREEREEREERAGNYGNDLIRGVSASGVLIGSGIGSRFGHGRSPSGGYLDVPAINRLILTKSEPPPPTGDTGNSPK